MLFACVQNVSGGSVEECPVGVGIGELSDRLEASLHKPGPGPGRGGEDSVTSTLHGDVHYRHATPHQTKQFRLSARALLASMTRI